MLSRPATRLMMPCLLLSLSAAFSPLSAQGGNVDIIIGTVKDATGKAVQGAIVKAQSLETQVTRTATTNDKGRFTIIFNDGGGQYRVDVRAIGHQPFIQNVSRQSDDDRIMLDVRLGGQAVRVQDIVTRGQVGNANAVDRPTAAELSRTVTGEQAMHLPIDASDLSMLAALAPGVIFTGGTDSTGATFSVAGQSAESNTYLVNGATTDATTIPQDAVRSTRVTTNTYDVARGGFAGGQVSVTTKGGSNRVSGSLSSRLQDQHLAWGEATSNPFTSGQTREQLGAGFGGAIHKDHTFLFGSFQLNRSLAPMASLNLADPATLSRLGVSQDSVNRFTALVNATGLTALVGPVDPNRTSDQFQSTNRFDWNIGAEHILTVTGNFNITTQDPTRIGQTQLPQVGGNSSGHNYAGIVQLASRMGRTVNQFRAAGSVNSSHSNPFLLVPVGRVTNFSTLDSGRIAATTLGFGGNAGLPQSNSTRSLEVTNELSLIPGDGTHRIAFGAYGMARHFEQDVTNNRYGTFSYNSLADFASNLPSQFTRTLQPTIRDGSMISEAFYLSDAWRPRIGGGSAVATAGRGGRAGGGGGGRGGRGAAAADAGGNANLQLVYGVRLENSSYTGAPARNDSVFNEFGVRTDRLPNEFYVSPRIGFSYSIPAPEQMGNAQRGFAPPLLTVRGGAGIFRGTMPATLPGTAQAQSGLSTAQTQLFCVGSAVPIPDWQQYSADPSTIPDECIGGIETPVTTGRPSVTVYDANYGAPKTKRASLGATRRITQRITFNVDASYVRGVGQSAVKDLNLNETPRFTLGGVDHRPVYASPTQIVTTTGAVPLSASRIDPAFGAVHNVFSALQNETKQVTFNLTGTTSKQVQLNLAYTLMFARDEGGNGGGLGGGNLTAGDPNVYSWARSSNERRHNIQATVSWPITPAFELTSVARITSGSHYTPMVAGDINGDGARNDRAFVYSASDAPDTAVASAMTRLLASTSGNAKKCLASQLGKVADRNSCTGPWQPSLELQMNWRPGFFDRRMSLSFQTLNLLGGVDELLHGANDLKGWGGNARPDATLLTVRGFDATTQQFKYVVNERFGNTSASATAVRAPFQLAVNIRYAIGYDQRTAQIQGLARPNAATPANARSLVDSFMVSYRRQNAATAALEQKEALALTADQVAVIQHLADSAAKALTPDLDSLTFEVDRVQKAGSSADPVPLLQRIRQFTAVALRTQAALNIAVRKALTEVQWALLPDAVRTPLANPFAGGLNGRGGGAGGGGRGGGGRRGGGGA